MKIGGGRWANVSRKKLRILARLIGSHSLEFIVTSISLLLCLMGRHRAIGCGDLPIPLKHGKDYVRLGPCSGCGCKTYRFNGKGRWRRLDG